MKEKNIVFNGETNRLILIYLNKKVSDYSMNVARNIRCSSTGIVNKLKELRDNGLIEKADNKKKKKCPSVCEDIKRKYFKLTDRGKRIAELLLEINKEVNDK